MSMQRYVDLANLTWLLSCTWEVCEHSSTT